MKSGSWLTLLEVVQRKYPKAKAVVFAAWNISHYIYEDDTYENEVACIKYNYDTTIPLGLFYTYELFWGKHLPKLHSDK